MDDDKETTEIVDEAIKLTVGEICDWLRSKAERCAEVGEGRQAVFLETMADYVWTEWGEL